ADGGVDFINTADYKEESGMGFWEWVGVSLAAAAVIALTVLTCGAILAAIGPIIALALACLPIALITTAMVTAVTVAVYVVAITLVVATIAVTINDIAAMFTGYSFLGDLMGREGYETFRTVVMFTDVLFIGMGDMARQAGYGQKYNMEQEKVRVPKRQEQEVHGNSLKTTKPCWGYELRDNTTGEIKKYGETTLGFKRYTHKWYDENNVHMSPVKFGSKVECRQWESQMLQNWYDTHGQKLPEFNYD
ncbi:MAG: hypothetical protein LBE13_21915, partial [Bacteroidales bacterium]|nr:hypothetical protein [Bacteroidales bacterium]